MLWIVGIAVSYLAALLVGAVIGGSLMLAHIRRMTNDAGDQITEFVVPEGSNGHEFEVGEGWLTWRPETGWKFRRH